jgi:hypothetical protein
MATKKADENEQLANAIIALERAAADFALKAGASMAARYPDRYARMKGLFSKGLAELHVAVQLSPERQIRWVMDVGGMEEVLFDSARATPLPPPPSYR